MSPEGAPSPILPVQVRDTLDEFRSRLDLDLRVWSLGEDGSRTAQVYPALDNGAPDGLPEPLADSVLRCLSPQDGPSLQLKISSSNGVGVEDIASLLQSEVERALDFAQEVRFFTHELSGRYEEINLLYSISETLGSILILEEATDDILREVCDVLGAGGGSLWVYDRRRDLLRLTASVGPGSTGPLAGEKPDAVTSQVFEEGRSLLGGRGDLEHPRWEGPATDISVPISYSRRSGESRIVGVIDLFGRVSGELFTTRPTFGIRRFRLVL